MLCYAEEQCGMKISICDVNNQPVPLSEFCPFDNDNNSLDNNNDKLKSRLDDPEGYLATYKPI
jgi:hypothetical protein